MQLSFCPVDWFFEAIEILGGGKLLETVDEDSGGKLANNYQFGGALGTSMIAENVGSVRFLFELSCSKYGGCVAGACFRLGFKIFRITKIPVYY